MGSGGFSICLILGIVLFAVGWGTIALILMGVGAVGLLTATAGGRN